MQSIEVSDVGTVDPQSSESDSFSINRKQNLAQEENKE
jgi:hypothetical protein